MARVHCNIPSTGTALIMLAAFLVRPFQAWRIVTESTRVRSKPKTGGHGK